jgi:tetratricopeptide (TPR) repeat protein
MSRRDSSRITPVLQRQYRDAAKAGDWVRCRILAEQMRGLERDNKLAAEAAYALSYALEMLGDRTQAAKHYEHALLIDPSHAKARRRLNMLPPWP